MEKININGAIIMNNEPNKGLIYSEDKGKTWYYSNVKTGHFPFISIAGNTVIAHNNFNDDFHYSKDYGKTWYKVNTNNIIRGSYCLTVIDNTVIAGSWSNKGLLYSEDNGITWKESNIKSGKFYHLIITGDTVIAGGNSYNGIYYSEDCGKTWIQSNINIGNTKLLIVNDNIVIANVDDTFFYSEDKGKTWHYSRIMKNDKYYDYDVKEDSDILNSLRDDLLSIFNEVNNYVNLERRAVNNDQYITYIHSQIKDIMTRYQFSKNKKVESILIELSKLL